MQRPDYDFIVIGSGFGGSVSALRLSQKGYRVLVIERGKRFSAEDFPKTNWSVRKYLWAPRLRCFGIQALTFLKDVMILHGVGVGGGSLVYANTLIQPPDEVFSQVRWPKIGDWKAFLSPHYETARTMLGATKAKGQGPADDVLVQIAKDLGREASVHHTNVGVYFGEEGVEVADPYFGGEGPPRKGCVMCGGCMVGCRHNAKNSLDKNYLYLAEKRGAEVLAETHVRAVHQVDDGYEVQVESSTSLFWRRKQTLRAKGVVFSGGVLGTVPLLFACKKQGGLTRLSERLGDFVRTNSEALTGVRAKSGDTDYSKGIAIASGMYPDANTHVEPVRYGAGQDFMALLTTFLVNEKPGVSRRLSWLRRVLSSPLEWRYFARPFGWAKNATVLLFMQTLDNHMSLRPKRRWWWPWSFKIDTCWQQEGGVPKYFPIAQDTTQRFADKINGIPQNSIAEVMLNISSTAHILGGCPMGQSPEEGVVDPYGRVFGYDNLYVADGSIVPVNLSVNPSLTITALSEWVMHHVPKKEPPLKVELQI